MERAKTTKTKKKLRKRYGEGWMDNLFKNEKQGRNPFPCGFSFRAHPL
jgi:hypothetical protein